MAYSTNLRTVLKNINKDKIGTIFLEIVFIDSDTKKKIRRYISSGQKIHEDDVKSPANIFYCSHADWIFIRHVQLYAATSILKTINQFKQVVAHLPIFIQFLKSMVR